MSMYKNRLKRFRLLMEKKNLEACLVVDPLNVFYTTGYWSIQPYTVRFYGSLTSRNDTVLVVPILDKDLAEEFSWVKNIKTYSESVNPLKFFINLISDLGLSKANIGIEMDYLAISVYQILKNGLPNAKFNDCSRILEKTRMIKSQDEIRIARKTASMGDKALAAAIEAVRENATEKEITEAARRSISLDEGYWAPLVYQGTPYGVQAGPSTLHPHWIPSHRRIHRGDLVIIDLCGILFYKGYHASCGRTVVVGAPSVKQKKVFECVLEAQTKAKEAIEPGVKASDIDKIARKIIKGAGYGEYFPHGTGHAIGLHYYEKPYLRAYDHTSLHPGMYFNVMAGIYYPKNIGIRLEDTVLVSEDGYEALTKYTHELQTR